MALSNKENVLRVFRGQEGERVPWIPFVGVHAAAVINVPLAQYLNSAELIAKGVVESARLYKADAIPLCFDLQIEAELLGASTKILPKMPPAIIKHPLALNGDISALPEYEANSGRLKCVLDASAKIKQDLGDDTAICALATGVLTLAYQLRGRRLLDDMAQKSSYFLELLEYAKSVQLKTIKAYVERGVDIVAIVEPMCSNLPEGFFRDVLLPFEDELFDFIHRANLPSSFFLCGDVSSIIEEICASEAMNICACSNLDLGLLKQKALASNKSFGGNLNPLTVKSASVKECVEAAKACLGVGGKKGYILSSGCDIAFDTPCENLRAIAALCS